MSLIRPAALMFATVITIPAMYRAFVTEDLDMTSALGRFLVAVPVAALLLAGLRYLTAEYGQTTANRRSTDEPEQGLVDPPPE